MLDLGQGPVTMRALSLLQPWAWLVAEGHKPVENRRWHLPMKMRDVPFLIHSSGARRKEEFAEAKELAERVAWQTRTPPVKIPDPDELVYGALLAVGEAHDCLCPAERQMSLLDDSSPHPWWMRAQHGFFLQNVRKLQTPVISQGLSERTWPPEARLNENRHRANVSTQPARIRGR